MGRMTPLQSNSLAYRQYDDEELLRLVRKSDTVAYEAFYDRYAQTAYSVILRIVRDNAIAEELLHETFWQVWQSATTYEGRGQVAAWLLRIARNRALDELRRQRARPQAALQEFEVAASNIQDFRLNTERNVEQQLQRRDVLQALESIPEDQRLCLELAYFDGLTQREIAERFNLSLGTVKSRMRIGMEKLERLLRGAGYP
ncbi:MAG: sigma-70 family RNA polymerase sigma factor [Caldilineaceae bacterium]